MKILLLSAILYIICCTAACDGAQRARGAPSREVERTRDDGTKSPEARKAGQALTETGAIGLAEDHIRRNGYTDSPADKEKLDFESIESSPDANEILDARRDSLERRAYGVSRGRRGGADGWTVVFKYKNSTSRKGRAVTMNSDGSETRVEHVDFILEQVDKKL